MANRQAYSEALERRARDNEPAWLKTLRHRGARQFSELGFPTQNEEAWRFTDISPIADSAFDLSEASSGRLTPEEVGPFVFNEADWTELVFVNGLFARDLSTLPEDGAIVASLAQGMSAHAELIERHLGQYANEEDAFAALNTSLFRDGAFIYLPQDTHLTNPIHLLFIGRSSAQNTASHTRNLLIAGVGSAASIIETHVGLDNGGACLSNNVTEIVLEPNAHINWYKTVNQRACGYHLALTQVVQQDTSVFKSSVITSGGRIVRNALNVLLEGESAECHLNGLYLNDANRLIDNHLFVDHAAPHCTSRIAYRGVLDGASRAVFTGNVLVRKQAQKTDSNQVNHNLLLSEGARINTQPQLRIFADDVKCTHGATAGQFPEEILFYFQTRGIGLERARNMLTQAFARDILNRIEIKQLRQRLERILPGKYSSASE